MEIGTELSPSCPWCGYDLQLDEINEPQGRDEDGDPVCDDCWRSEHYFECCLCGEYESNEQQASMLLIVDTRAVRCTMLPVGLYRIKRLPYFYDGMTEGGIFSSSIEYAGPVPKTADLYPYSSGHLCRECIRKHEALTTI